jgi:hypothetical protein
MSAPDHAPRFSQTRSRSNGNGNGGHEFGVSLADDERWAIIEYMKTF